jgi:sodium transport system ATP-binding protein
VIEVSALHKSFLTGTGRAKQLIPAVRGISFGAADGQVTGLVGPNGAGKTTTLRMIATLVVPDSGHATIDGLDSVTDSLEVRKGLGVLSDARGLYSRLTTRENIRYYGRLRGMADPAIDAALERLAGLIEMGPLLDRRAEGFSQGERMKVAIARALIHDPKNLVLDEPTNGLDILSTRALRELIRRLKDAGKCILISSHIMQEIVALADSIVIVAEGRTVARGTAEELLEATGASNLEDAFVALSRPREGGTANEASDGAPDADDVLPDLSQLTTVPAAAPAAAPAAPPVASPPVDPNA